MVRGVSGPVALQVYIYIYIYFFFFFFGGGVYRGLMRFCQGFLPHDSSGFRGFLEVWYLVSFVFF